MVVMVMVMMMMMMMMVSHGVGKRDGILWFP